MRTFGLVLLVTCLLLAQQDTSGTSRQPSRALILQRVSTQLMYHRVWAVVPMIGSGSAADPRRPMFVPAPGQAASGHSGVIGYQMLLSDDKKSALVEFVGASPKELRHIAGSTAPGVKAFERGKASQALIQAEFRRFRADFSVNMFNVRPQ